jgi:hypothetical protein
VTDLRVTTLLIEPDARRGAVELAQAPVALLARLPAQDKQGMFLCRRETVQVA